MLQLRVLALASHKAPTRVQHMHVKQRLLYCLHELLPHPPSSQPAHSGFHPLGPPCRPLAQSCPTACYLRPLAALAWPLVAAVAAPRATRPPASTAAGRARRAATPTAGWSCLMAGPSRRFTSQRWHTSSARLLVRGEQVHGMSVQERPCKHLHVHCFNCCLPDPLLTVTFCTLRTVSGHAQRPFNSLLQAGCLRSCTAGCRATPIAQPCMIPTWTQSTASTSPLYLLVRFEPCSGG